MCCTYCFAESAVRAHGPRLRSIIIDPLISLAVAGVIALLIALFPHGAQATTPVDVRAAPSRAALAPASQETPSASEQAQATDSWGIALGDPRVIDGQAAGAHSVWAADLDNDGDLDVVSASGDDGVIRWYQNDGGEPPRFQTYVVATIGGAYAVSAADIDGDGHLDILATAVGTVRPSSQSEEQDAAAPQAGGSVIWYKSDGTSTPGFAPRLIIDTLNYPVSVHAADLDSDGDLDIMSASRDDNTIMWYENNGSTLPSFSVHVLSNSANGAVSVHAGDLDRDGDIDLVSASENDNQITWYENERGSPVRFTPHIIRIAGTVGPPNVDYAKAVYVADVNRDGAPDIVYASEDDNEVGWYRNDNLANPTFSQHVIATNLDHIKSIHVSDVDRDGDVDIFTASTGDNTFAWFQNDGAHVPSFTAHIITQNAAGARGIFTADLDQDGDLDILTASRVEGRIAWYPNQTIHRSALYSAEDPTIIAIQNGSRYIHAADLDGDGDRDLASISNDGVYWYENDGQTPPAFRSRVVSSDISGGRWVSAADLDRDGDLDLMTASLKDHTIAWHENLGGSPLRFRKRVVSLAADGPRSVMAADLDRDGDLDLYAASDIDNMIAWFENDGRTPPRFDLRIVTTDALYARSAYAADVDGDGHLDLLSASQITDEIAWYRNSGNRFPKFSKQIITRGADGAQHVHAADLDGDGDMDVLSASEHDDEITWYENRDGAPPTFVTRWVDKGKAPGVHAVFTGDADQDGDIDVFAAIEHSNTIAWYENDGQRPPGFVYHAIYTKATAAHSIFADDIDGDGDLDLLATSRDDGKLMRFENLGGQYRLAVDVSSSKELIPGRMDDMARIEITHRGRAGDDDIQIIAFELEFRDVAGRLLDQAELRNRIGRLRVYRSDCCGANFSAASADFIAEMSPLELTSGQRLIVAFPAREPMLRLAVGQKANYFIAVELLGTCASSPSEFRAALVVTNRTVQNSRDGIPLLGERMRGLAGDSTTVVSTPQYLFINEVMADNNHTLEDSDEPGEYPDWIELYNSSVRPVSLAGMYLSDDLTAPTRYRIPDGVTIGTRGYLRFYADGDFAQGPLHTNFRLDKDGESIGLFDTDENDNQVIDVFSFGKQPPDMTTGRFPDGADSWMLLEVPTPGARNVDKLREHRSFLPMVTYKVGC